MLHYSLLGIIFSINLELDLASIRVSDSNGDHEHVDWFHVMMFFSAQTMIGVLQLTQA